MWDYLLQASLCLGLLYVPYHLWFQRETFFGFNRWYLVIAMIISAIFPVLPRWIAVQEPVFITLPAVHLSDLTDITVLSGFSAGWHWTNILILAYWSVAAFMILRLGADLLAIFRMFYSGEKRRLKGATLVIHPQATAPFSFFNYVFVTPAIVENDALFNYVVNHEMQHIRGRHSLDVLLLEVLCAILWVSPLIYLYRRAVKNVHEYLADNVVSQDLRIDYAQLLISQAHSGLRLALTNQFFESQLKSRIIMMMKEPSRRINKWKYLLAVPVLAVSIVLFSFRNAGENDPAEIEMSSFAQDTVPQEIFKVVEEMPRFPGCEDAGMSTDDRFQCAQKRLLEFVYQNLKYPSEAQTAGLEGRVVAQFVIERNGAISGIKVVRDIGGGCGPEVTRVLGLMNEMSEKWTPGRQRGKAVRVQFTIPVLFKLSDDEPAISKATDAPDRNIETIFQVVEEMPRFPGCEDMDGMHQDKFNCSLKKLMEYVDQNLHYPEEAKNNNVEGKAVVQFVVEPTGVISTIKCVKSLGYGCDVEVIRVMESMNSMPDRWIPGRQRGQPVRVMLTLPVSFKL